VISSRTPADQATDASITAPVVVVFNEALDASSIDAQALTLTDQAIPVAGTLTYDANSMTLTFMPDAPLMTETVYGVSVASTLKDMAGNSFLGDDWFFTTGGPYNLGATSQTTIDQCMDDNDKLMLTLVNNARAISRSCGTLVMTAQPPLAWNCLLDDAALGHSTSMADNDFHAHVSPVDGSDPGDRIRATGYLPMAWGENIAAGFADEESVMDGWLTSPGHCENIMASMFTEIGAGFARNPASTYGIYWTQNFGRR
jgi:uncharacterized protein YkwD